jgi:hypothetical protein
MKLNEEQKRIKIAEACGWSNITPHRVHAGIEGLLGNHLAKDGVPSRNWIPDYFNDRNTTPELMKLLKTPEQRNIYINLLYDWCEAEEQPELDFEWLNSPQDRVCEAVGQTLGLWKEGE